MKAACRLAASRPAAHSASSSKPCNENQARILLIGHRRKALERGRKVRMPLWEALVGGAVNHRRRVFCGVSGNPPFEGATSERGNFVEGVSCMTWLGVRKRLDRCPCCCGRVKRRGVWQPGRSARKSCLQTSLTVRRTYLRLHCLFSCA
jgi:hypothetical protein